MSNEDELFEVGTISWSMFLAIYVLSLHSDGVEALIEFDAIKDMLDVLQHDLGEMIPIQNDLNILISQGPFHLKRFKELGLIEVVDLSERDPFKWKILMTQRGLKRGKGLFRAVGLQVTIGVNLTNKHKNNITINVYDKDMMPLVDNLYFTDQTEQIKTMKGEDHDASLLFHSTD